MITSLCILFLLTWKPTVYSELDDGGPARSHHHLQNNVFPSMAVVNTKSCTYMIGRGASSSSSCATTIAVLAGAPLRRGGVGVLALACDCSNGTEHLRGHVAWEGVDSSRQV